MELEEKVVAESEEKGKKVNGNNNSLIGNS